MSSRLARLFCYRKKRCRCSSRYGKRWANRNTWSTVGASDRRNPKRREKKNGRTRQLEARKLKNRETMGHGARATPPPPPQGAQTGWFTLARVPPGRDRCRCLGWKCSEKCTKLQKNRSSRLAARRSSFLLWARGSPPPHRLQPGGLKGLYRELEGSQTVAFPWRCRGRLRCLPACVRDVWRALAHPPP